MSKWTIQEDDASSYAICIGGEPVFWYDPERYQGSAEYIIRLVEGGCEHEWETVRRCERCGVERGRRGDKRVQGDETQ